MPHTSDWIQTLGSNTQRSPAWLRWVTLPTTLGKVLVAESEAGLCAILAGKEPELLLTELLETFPKAHLCEATPELKQRAQQVAACFENPALAIEHPLALYGTPFQQKVWQVLRSIPVGTTVSYSDLAIQLNMPKAVRAIAQACAANCLALAIPCHRVVKRDGSLAGYRWGIALKQELLAREAAHAS